MTPLDARPAVASSSTGEGYRWDLDMLRIMAILGVVAIHVIGLSSAARTCAGPPPGTSG